LTSLCSDGSSVLVVVPLLECDLCVFRQNELKEKDLAVRKYEQEIDSLMFRNNQLSMRVNVLQQELDDAHARDKKHKVVVICELYWLYRLSVVHYFSLAV